MAKTKSSVMASSKPAAAKRKIVKKKKEQGADEDVRADAGPASRSVLNRDQVYVPLRQ